MSLIEHGSKISNFAFRIFMNKIDQITINSKILYLMHQIGNKIVLDHELSDQLWDMQQVFNEDYFNE